MQTSGFTDQVLANTAMKILGRVGHSLDCQSFGGAMGMTAEQIAWAKTHMQPGTFIVKLGCGRVLTPFLLFAPLIPHLPVVTPAIAKASQAALDHGPLVSVNDEAIVIEHRAMLPSPQPATPVVCEDELRFLCAVAANPGLPSSQFAKLLGISAKRAVATRCQLTSNGFITEHKMDSGKRGGRRLVLELTPAGRQVLKEAS